MKEQLKVIKQALLTGVSYMLPFVVAGGILVAIGFAFGGIFVYEKTGIATDIFWWGKKAFSLMVPVLAAYIAFSIADKPGLAAGFVGGLMADAQGSGFIGALIAGIVAGYLVQALKKTPIIPSLRSLLPTLIIPVLSVLGIGAIMQYILGGPVAALNAWTLSSLTSLQGGSILILGLIQGAMLGFDLGGPVNKAAYAFALAAFAAGNYAPMAANFIASMTPPLAIGAAMLIAKNKYTKTEKAATAGCVVGGLAMISEFAIPFAAADPIKVVPALMAGSAVGAATSYLLGLTMAAPHGGYFVSFLSNNIVLFTVALLVGTAVSTVLLILGRRNVKLEDLAVEGE